MNSFKKYFDHVSAEHYIPVYAVTATNDTTIVITERDIQDFVIEQSQIKNNHHFSFFTIRKIEREKNLILIEIDLKKSKQSYFNESNIESESFIYKFETNDANNFILYLNRALYRILTPEEIKSINVDECSKFITLFPPSSSSLNNDGLLNDIHSNNSEITNSIQPFYVYSRFIEKVLLSNSNSNERSIEKLVSEVSLKNLRKILKYKINKVNIFRDFPDCSKYFEILLNDIIPFSKYITNLVFDSSINSTNSNSIENYVECLIECVKKSKYLREITFISELPSGIENFFTKLSEEKEISILTLTFKNVQLSQQQLSILNSSKISSYRFSGQIFSETLFNFIETTNIDLLSTKNSPQTDFLSNMNKFTNLAVLSLCKNNIEIGDFFSTLSKSESNIQCLYLSGNKCEKQIPNGIKIPKFEELRLDNINWGDFFFSYFENLMKTQTFVDFSNSSMNENEWNKVFNYLNTTSDGTSQLCKLLWNGNRVNKSFFSYLRKCIDSLDSLQIVDVIDQSTEKEIFDEFISFLKEGNKLTNLFIGFSNQESKSMSGNQLKSILSALLINMKKGNSKKFYLSVPNSSSGDEGVDALIDLFNDIEGCKINFITFDGLQPKNPKKYIELCASVTKYVMKLRKMKHNTYEIQFPKNDLKFLKNKMQEKDYIKLHKDFRFILDSHKFDYLPSDFLFNRMVLSPVLKKKRFYVKPDDDDLFLFDLSSNSNIFNDSLSGQDFDKKRAKKKKKEKALSEYDSDDLFDAFLKNDDTNINKKTNANNNNNDDDDDDEESTESLSEDEIEIENLDNKTDAKNDKNEPNKDDDEFYENDKNRKSKEKRNNTNSKNAKRNSKTQNQNDDESNKDNKSKINNKNMNDVNENDESSEKNEDEDDTNSETEDQEEEESNKRKTENSNIEDDNENEKSNKENEEDENAINSKNEKRNSKTENKKEEESNKNIKRIKNSNLEDDTENEESSEKNKDENDTDSKTENQNEDENNKRKIKNSNIEDDNENDEDENVINRKIENQEEEESSNNKNDNSKSIKNSNTEDDNEKSNDEDENVINNKTENQKEEESNNNKSNKMSNDENDTNSKTETNEEENSNNKNDEEPSSINSLSTKPSGGQEEEEENINSKTRSINPSKKDDDKSDKSSEKNNEESNKDENPINNKQRIKNPNKNEIQIKDKTNDQNETDKISNSNVKDNESPHSISETQQNKHSKSNKKLTNKNASQIPQFEFEYEEEEEERNDQQISNQSKQSAKTKHKSSKSHSIKSDTNQNSDKNENEVRNENNKSNQIQTKNNNKNDENNEHEKTAQNSSIKKFTSNRNQGQKEEEISNTTTTNNKRNKNSSLKDKNISSKESINHKNEHDEILNNNNEEKIMNINENEKESIHSISESQQGDLLKPTKKPSSKNSSQIPKIEFDYEEDEQENSDPLAIGQKRHSPNMVKLSLSYSNVKKGEKNQKPHLEIEYEDENGKHKHIQTRKKSSNKSYQKSDQLSPTKKFTSNRNKGQIDKNNRSLSPNEIKNDLPNSSKRSRSKKKQKKSSSLISNTLSPITSLSFECYDRQKNKDDEYYESDNSYDEIEKLTTDNQNLTSNRKKRKIHSQTQKIEKVRKIDLLKRVPPKTVQIKRKRLKNKNNQSQYDEVLTSTQDLTTSRRLSLPHNEKNSSLELVEDRGSDIEFPEMDEITLKNPKKRWEEIEEKFSLNNILHDIRANK